MRAAVIREYGSNDVVDISDVDAPVPGAGEVLIRVHAAGVNPKFVVAWGSAWG